MESLAILKNQIQILMLEVIGYEGTDLTPKEYRTLAHSAMGLEKLNILVSKPISILLIEDVEEFHREIILKMTRYKLSTELLPLQTPLGLMSFPINHFDIKELKNATSKQAEILLKTAIREIKFLISVIRSHKNDKYLNIFINKPELKR